MVTEHLQILAQRAQSGHVDSFGKIYDLLVEKIYRFIFFRIGVREETEDLTEEVFFKVYQKIQSYRNEGVPFEAWIFKIARNQIIDYYRTKKDLSSLDDHFEIEDPGLTPEEYTEKTISQEEMLEALKKIPDSYQELIILKFIEGKDNEEISHILDKPIAHIRVLQSRSLKALKKVVKKEKKK